MSSGSGSGRLPSLKNSSGSSALKFKPKFLARRTKEERDASAPKVQQEDIQRHGAEGKRGNDRKPAGNLQRRVPRYLNNTHVISSGPLAAGNFVSDKSGDLKRSFIKSEGASSSLVHKGLQIIDTADVESDENDEDAVEKKDLTNETERKGKSKFNMGREYTARELKNDDDEDEEFDSDVNMDDETWQAKKVEELFPIRPIRIRHEVLETVQKEIQDSFSENTTREPTPMAPVKREKDTVETGLQALLTAKEIDINERIKKHTLQEQFRSLDENESMQELKNLTDDHLRIWKKLNKINNKPKRFVLFQLPSKLPNFEEITPKTEAQEAHQTVPLQDEIEKEQETKHNMQDKIAKRKLQQENTEKTFVQQDSLAGKIGSIRVHRSGRLSVNIGGVIMDINRGAETTFLQDVASLNDGDESASVELLGRLDGRMVVTPRF